MARPTKVGLDYFSFDVDFFQNKKVRRIKLACGPNSIAVLLALLCNIYRDKGYYIEWDEDLPFLIADEVGVSEGTAIEVIKKAIQVSFFDNELSKTGVLTSKEIQVRYVKVCKDAKRTNWEIRKELELTTVETIVSYGKTREETELIPPISTQSKVKESKVYISVYPFESFWDDYDKKVDRVKSENRYSKVDEEDRLKIKAFIPKYKLSQPDKQFRKNPVTFLNNKSWENEIIEEKQKKVLDARYG